MVGPKSDAERFWRLNALAFRYTKPSTSLVGDPSEKELGLGVGIVLGLSCSDIGRAEDRI